VDAGTGDLATPTLGASARIVEARERLTIEPTLAHERDLVFYARLVLRRPHTRRVYEQAARLHVIQEGGHERRAERVGI
jgi:hypothetical protein